MIEGIDAKLKVLLAEKAQSAEKESEMPAEPMSEVPIYRETANYAYEAGEMESGHSAIPPDFGHWRSGSLEWAGHGLQGAPLWQYPGLPLL